MAMLRDSLISLTGHVPGSPLLATVSPETIRQVAVLGGWVLLAVILTALNWGVAGWVLNPDPWTVILGICSAFLFMRFFDSSMVYLADTVPDRLLWMQSMLVIRLGIALIVSSLSANALMPLSFILGPEIQDTRNILLDEATTARRAELEVKYRVADNRQAITDIDTKVGEVTGVTSSAESQALQSLSACWAQAQALTDPLEVRRYSRLCRNQSDSLNGMADRSQVGSQVGDLQERRKTLLTDQEQTEASIASEMAAGAERDRETLTAASSRVQDEMFKRHPALMWKWIPFKLAIMVLELMPMLIKLWVGKTPLGLAVAFNIARDRGSYQNSLLMESARLRVLEQAIRTVEFEPVSDACKKELEQIMMRLAPLQAVELAMKELVRHSEAVAQATRTAPDIAALLAKLQQEALAKAAASR